MVEVKAIVLDEKDIVDPSAPGMMGLSDEAYRACLTAALVVTHDGRLIKSRFTCIAKENGGD